MDWDRAIDRNRRPLLRLAMMLAAILARWGERMPRGLRGRIARLLGPAESAARRLVHLTAQGMAAPAPLPSRPVAAKARKPARSRGFPMIDRRWPLVALPLEPAPFTMPEPRDPREMVPAGRLAERIGALRAALDDLPARALRVLRWEARRRAEGRGVSSALRTGLPPHLRRRSRHWLHRLLLETHRLTLPVVRPPPRPPFDAC